ncbi:MAG: glycosyltransferase [Woeseiaceae bacterium]|nr:glycosyltransferase [Woeseiaceae bacterium]
MLNRDSKQTVLLLRAGNTVLGAERVCFELCRHLPDLGIRPILGVPVGPDDIGQEIVSAATAEGFEVWPFEVSGAFDFGVIKRIRHAVQSSGVDVVHSHGYREDLYALGCSRHAKLLATNHLWKRTTLRLRAYAWLDSIMLRKFPRVVAVSKPIAREMLETGIEPQRIQVISNGIDTEAFRPGDDAGLRDQLCISPDSIVLGTVSSLTSEKAIDNAISAMALVLPEFPELKLLIVGDGPCREELERQVDDLSIAHAVMFLGRRSDMVEVYRALDVFLLPSLIEGLPMALLEAMACETPVVATSVGDVASVVDGSVGRLVEAGSVEQLADGIRRLVESESDRNRMSSIARQRVEGGFSSRAMASKYAEIYRSVLAGVS